MSSRKFRFVSPGVFLREVDQSQLPAIAEAVGPVIIGRTRKGPAMVPTKIRSLADLETVFGKPLKGGEGTDSWREGTGILAEGYATYAAKAYLTAGAGTDSPVTVVRLLGVAGDDAGSSDEAEPGWKVAQAHGLFLMEKKADMTEAKLELAAIFYSTTGSLTVKLRGPDAATGNQVTQIGKPVSFTQGGKLTIQLQDGSTTKDFTFAPESIRTADFNLNPVATNSHISSPPANSLAGKYWLGETFEETIKKFNRAMEGSNSTRAAVVLELNSSMADFKGENYVAKPAVSGWVFGQDTTLNTGSFDVTSHQKLFRIHSLHEGIESSKDIIIGIEKIIVPRDGAQNRYGKFDVVVKRLRGTGLEVIDTFSECDLDPSSDNFIAKKIGDQYREWVPGEKRNRIVGEHPIRGNGYVRVEVNEDILAQGGPQNEEQVPFGFYGPIRPVTQTVQTAIVGKVAASATVTFASVPGNGELLRVTDHAGTAVDFTVATGSASNSGDGLTVGTQGLTLASEIAAQFAAAITANVTTNTTATAAGDELTITQDAVGTDGNQGGPNSPDISHNMGVAVSSLVQFTGGNDGALSTSPAFGESSWVSGTIDMSGLLSSVSQSVNVQFPDSLLVNTASSNANSRFLGFSPFAMSYSTSSAHGANKSKDGSQRNRGMIDYVRRLADHSDYPTSQDSGDSVDGKTEHAFKFSLDEVVLYPTPTAATAGGVNQITTATDVLRAVYVSGSRTGASDSATSPTKSWTWHMAKGQVSGSNANNFRTLLEIVDGFHMPLVGGNDGVDITESDPFNARVLDGGSTATNYAYASVDRALELIKDAEELEHNLAVMPGITEESLTTKLVDLCEARADSLAIIDLPDIYKPRAERSMATSQRTRGTTPETSARNLVERQLNSSYGAAYYPWVKIRDAEGSADVWVPPSVIALGTMAYTQKVADVWFAPAGFNRGGLGAGNAGFAVLQTSERLLAKDRDTLYDANINPIASFASEGIVVFGQKTLQSSQSALDRINVRRLLIHVKKIVSRISSNLLFEPNVQATWARFSSKVTRELDSIKVGLGLTDYKVVLDTTTTTPDLIDRNIMYAKIFLKPARAIEFIAVDFVITNTGAAYDD